MPEVCRFLGIVICFHYREHLPPHFHAIYGEHEAQIALGSHAVLAGHLPGRVLGLVQEWAEIHRAELFVCWDEAQAGRTPAKIEPLT